VVGVGVVSATAQLLTAVFLVAGDASGSSTAIGIAVLTSMIGAVGSVVGALLARGIRSRDEEQDAHLRRLEELVTAPRRIGARAGDEAVELQPPEVADADAE
jgi:hypothetical protein